MVNLYTRNRKAVQTQVARLICTKGASESSLCLLSTETPAMEDPLIHIVSLEPGHARDVYKPYWLIYLNNSHIPGDVKETSKPAGDFLLPGFFKAVLKTA